MVNLILRDNKSFVIGGTDVESSTSNRGGYRPNAGCRRLPASQKIATTIVTIDFLL